jgi:hypothetical protein
VSDRLKRIFDNDEHDLLKVTHKSKSLTPQDKLEQSFFEIVDFYTETRRIPRVDTTEMAERKLGIRLRAIMLDDTKVEALKCSDEHHLLTPESAPESIDDLLNSDQFGLLDDPTGILTVRNVPKDVKRPDQIARVRKAKNFAQYESLFHDMHARMKASEFIRVRISSENQIKKARFFVLRGVLIYVADEGEKFASKVKVNAKLHVIYENGTESNILLRSLARSLYRSDDEGGGSRVVPIDYKELPEWQDTESVTSTPVDSKATADDTESGYIYVLKSKSDVPQVQDVPDLYKIGFTTGVVEDRVKNAATDPTYLNAPVETVATYKCYNMNTRKLEHILHRFFGAVKLDMGIISVGGKVYVPSEWYSVPLEVIDEAIDLISDETITEYRYDLGTRSIVSGK